MSANPQTRADSTPFQGVVTAAGPSRERVDGSAALTDYAVLLDKLADEIADTATYLDLLAHFYGIDLADAIARKFNAVSEREGLPERLPTTTGA